MTPFIYICVYKGVEYRTRVNASSDTLLRALMMLTPGAPVPPSLSSPRGESSRTPAIILSDENERRDSRGGDGGGGGGDATSSPPPPPIPSEAPQPGIDANGRFVGANDDYHQDNAVQTETSKDSGKYYREADWAGLVRKPKAAVGPKQVPLQERVSLGERAEQINASRYGTRVNPASKERGYSLDGTEKEVFIDPRRNLDEHVARPSKTAPQSIPLPPKQIAATVLFETTAVGAKLRNTHKVGGERVRISLSSL